MPSAILVSVPQQPQMTSARCVTGFGLERPQSTQQSDRVLPLYSGAVGVVLPHWQGWTL